MIQTLPNIIEEIIATPSGGIITDEVKLDNPYIESLVHEYRAKALVDMWANRRVKRINPLWLQQCVLEYSKDLQEDECFVKFVCPATIRLDNKTDGMLYVGTIEGNCPYDKVSTRAELSDILNHRITKNNVVSLYSDGLIEIWNNPLCESVRIDGIFNVPTEVPTYNKWKDPYPISPDLLVTMKNMLFQIETSKTIVVHSDKISDSTDTRELIKTK